MIEPRAATSATAEPEISAKNKAVYDHMSGGQMQDVGPEGWRSDVTYHFRAGDGVDVLIAAAQQPPVDDA